MDASIIICTRNRASKLHDTLMSLSLMQGTSTLGYEVIVVDNGSTDDTSSVVADWSGTLPLQYLHEAQAGLSRARNRGVAACRGRSVLFTDDDCIVAPGWLAAGVRLLADTPRQVIGGRVDLHDPTDLPITIRFEDKAASLSSIGELSGFLHGCNMIFGRCVFEEIGPFDPLLGAGTPCKAAEDSDFTYRAYRRGIPVQYRPELRLAHNHGRKGAAEEASLMDGYALSLGAMAFKYLLRGDASLLRSAYWTLRLERRGQRQRRLLNYAAGAINYGKSSIGRLFVP